MYTPDQFKIKDLSEIHSAIAAAPLANLVTVSQTGPVPTPLPMLLKPQEGAYGTLYGHIARVNPQWRTTTDPQALALFSGPDAYVSPSYYPSKAETGKVVPTWNYVTIQAKGDVEFFSDTDRLLALVNELTDSHETGRDIPWRVADAPERFVEVQLRGIIGVRLEIAHLEGKAKLSQNRSPADQRGVIDGLRTSNQQAEALVARLMASNDDPVTEAKDD
ncbi:FMN-binding negative transcriptional regulator [Roseibium sp. RKSG952]|uniref:FMN-binding negative transcriptional regulator n=1 Tax=Roseibium sp. RKSG952 TaxID=2529384 RepID=UPI0013C7F1E0|nr:FMN-binding negative transcriptional regulator [Roseibium sp. RKSG952]